MGPHAERPIPMGKAVPVKPGRGLSGAPDPRVEPSSKSGGETGKITIGDPPQFSSDRRPMKTIEVGEDGRIGDGAEVKARRGRPRKTGRPGN